MHYGQLEKIEDFIIRYHSHSSYEVSRDNRTAARSVNEV